MRPMSEIITDGEIFTELTCDEYYKENAVYLALKKLQENLEKEGK